MKKTIKRRVHMKQILKSVIVGLLAASALSICASADFTKTKTYTDGMFTDVPANEWYASSVQDAYELGIMQGDSATTFSPNGTLTVAEGVTIAARIHETLTGKTIADASGEWYTKYVNYAIENGFLKEGRFEDYERTIKRSDMAELLGGVCGELPTINTVDSLPDVGEGSTYGDDVFKLYRAGILTGNDGYGTFAPDSKLLRSEISAMAVRIALSDKRVQKSFEKTDVRGLSDAYYLIDMMSEGGPTGLANGWDYDNRFDLFNKSGSYPTSFTDATDEQFMSFSRKFDIQRDGLLHLEMTFYASSTDGAAYLAFRDEEENILVQITPKNGKWVLVGKDEKATSVEIKSESAGKYRAVMDVDLDNRTAHLVLNNTDCGTVSIQDGDIASLVLGSNKKGTSTVALYNARLSKNYVISEHFIADPDDKAPAGWDITGAWKLATMNSERGYDLTSLKSVSKAGGVSTAKRAFISPVAGKLSMETMILLPEKTDGASVSFTSGGTSVVTFETRDGKIYVGDNMVNDYTANVWQTLHVEADTAAGKADIYVNGKKKATVDITATYFDGVTVSFAPKTDAVMWFDDVQVCPVIEHDDYPAYPQVAESKDYNIGVNCCWLWRDQHSGEGWDSVSSFAEFEPYIGYYDEGLRETADWELKWLAEHGVDFIHACWYCPSGAVKEPIKKMRHSYYALHDGYMMAKYSDLVDFCIMWENNGQDCTTFEQFRDFIWNYWMEYYFSDPRYARLDNKAVLTVWNMNAFQKAFGDMTCADAVQFMNDELKKIGYDGIIILASTQGENPVNTYNNLNTLGYDATYGYHWGTKGYSADHQINCNRTDLKNAQIAGSHHIPTVSIGFNDVGRNHSRDPIITPEDHLKVCEDIKAQLAEMNTGTWRDNTLIVSTTNEYSEGTYFLPTESTGYAYLENIRKTFTDDTTDHTALDVRATAEQKERVTRLYPNHRSVIRWHQNEASDSLDSDTGITADDLVPTLVYDMSDSTAAASWKIGHGFTGMQVKDGALCGESAQTDFSIVPTKFEEMQASENPYLHIRMKSSVKASFEVFFATASSPSLDQAKRKEIQITKTGEFVDYVVNMSTNAQWSGLITSIRIDPLTKAGAFEISKIEFMNVRASNSVPSISVNGTDLTFTFRIKELEDGDYEVVGQKDEDKGFYSLMRFYHEWNRDAGVLTIKTPSEQTILFTVGSDKVTVDGKEQDLGYTFRLRDGLPVFHMKKLCELVGYKYTMNDKIMEVQSASDADYEMLKSMVPNQWEFKAAVTMDWKAQNCTLSVMDDCLHIVPTNGDPAIMQTVGFRADEYNRLVVGVKYNEQLKSAGNPQFFFRTTTSNSYTADKCFTGEYNFKDKKEGDIVEVVFDLTKNPLYNGNISGARFDPCGKVDYVDVDYIRFEYVEGAVKKDAELLFDDAYSWDFSTAEDAMEWQAQNSSKPEIKNGFLFSSAQNGDPAVHRAVSFNANDYQVCVIGVRYAEGLQGANPEFFFTTEESGNWEAAKGMTAKYSIPALTNVGEVIEVRFNLYTCAKWAGNVNHIRFDPLGWQTDYEIAYIRLGKIDGYEAEEKEVKLPDAVKPTKPTAVTITDPEKLPEGIKVEAVGGILSVVEDPDDSSKKVFQVGAKTTGENAYNYFNLYMHLEAGKKYKVSYELYPLKTVSGADYKNALIGGNFRYSTTNNPTVSDHTFATEINHSSGRGWKKIEATYEVADTYSATDKDCFQLWGKPINAESIGYLVKNITISAE